MTNTPEWYVCPVCNNTLTVAIRSQGDGSRCAVDFVRPCPMIDENGLHHTWWGVADEVETPDPAPAA